MTYQSWIMIPRLTHSCLSHPRLQQVRDWNIQSCHGWWRHPWLMSSWQEWAPETISSAQNLSRKIVDQVQVLGRGCPWTHQNTESGSIWEAFKTGSGTEAGGTIYAPKQYLAYRWLLLWNYPPNVLENLAMEKRRWLNTRIRITNLHTNMEGHQRGTPLAILPQLCAISIMQDITWMYLVPYWIRYETFHVKLVFCDLI